MESRLQNRITQFNSLTVESLKKVISVSYAKLTELLKNWDIMLESSAEISGRHVQTSSLSRFSTASGTSPLTDLIYMMVTTLIIAISHPRTSFSVAVF